MCTNTIIWAGKQNIPTQEKIVLWALANAKNHKTHKCFPSIPTIQKFTGLSRSAVIRSLKYLEEVKLITPAKRQGTSNNYVLDVELFIDKPVSHRHQCQKTPKDKKPSNQCLTDTGGVSDRHGGGVSQTPKPVSKPVSKPERSKRIPQSPKSDHILPTSLFDDFWKVVPRKVDKKDTAKLFKKLSLEKQQWAIDAYQQQIADREKLQSLGHWVEPQWASPSVWLRKERYNNERNSLLTEQETFKERLKAHTAKKQAERKGVDDGGLSEWFGPTEANVIKFEGAFNV